MTEFFCPSCGNAVEVDETFCGKCGSNVRSEQVQSVPSPQQQNSNPPTSLPDDEKVKNAMGSYQFNRPFVFGVISLVLLAIGYVIIIYNPFMSAPFHLVGLITGIIGVVKAKKDKAMAIIGIVLSSIGLLISLGFLISYMILLYAMR